MKHYSYYLKSALKKIGDKNSNEVSKKLIPKEKQALTVTALVVSIPLLVTLVTVAIN